MTIRDTIANYPPELVNAFLGLAFQAWSKVAADGAAATTTPETPIGQTMYGGEVTAIRFVPGAALTGDNANNATILIQKRTGAGGPTTVATLTTTVANGNWVAFVPITIPVTAGKFLNGDVFTITISKGGTGVVVPLGQLEMFQG